MSLDPSTEATDAAIRAEVEEAAYAVSRGVKPVALLELVAATSRDERAIRAIVHAARTRKSWGWGSRRPRFRIGRVGLDYGATGLAVLVYADPEMRMAWDALRTIKGAPKGFKQVVQGLLLGYGHAQVAEFARKVRRHGKGC